MQRSRRGSGIAVDPARVREARLAAGLSLADIARDDVSRTFIHFVENGQSRPSKQVLELIARRTGRPLSYFVAPQIPQSRGSTDVGTELETIAARIRQLRSGNGLTRSECEALKLLEVTIMQGARLTRTVERRSGARSVKPRLLTASRAAKKAS